MRSKLQRRVQWKSRLIQGVEGEGGGEREGNEEGMLGSEVAGSGGRVSCGIFGTVGRDGCGRDGIVGRGGTVA